MGPSMKNRCDTGACVGDNASHNNNPQEGQGGETALACDEPHCYTWGTMSSGSVGASFPSELPKPALRIVIVRECLLLLLEFKSVMDPPCSAPVSSAYIME